MKIAYVRVSTVEQNEARQIEALKKYDVDKWFTEKVSAKDTNRPQLQAMIDLRVRVTRFTFTISAAWRVLLPTS